MAAGVAGGHLVAEKQPGSGQNRGPARGTKRARSRLQSSSPGWPALLPLSWPACPWRAGCP
eukprot:2322671-Lingulodinium_polyedra.AAC.1